MDVTSAIPTLIGMVADGVELKPAIMQVDAEDYTFQFNPSTLRLSQTNGRTPGQTVSQGKDGSGLLALPPVKGCALRFTVIIDRSEVRSQTLLETAAYMLNSLNPLFVPIPASKTKSLLRQPFLPPHVRFESLVNQLELASDPYAGRSQAALSCAGCRVRCTC